MKDEITLLNEVMNRIPNKYMAMIVAAKRAKELNQGAKPLVKIDAEKPTTVALSEIAAGLIEPKVGKVDKEILLIDSDSDEIIPTPEFVIDEIEEEIREADEDIDSDDDDDEMDDDLDDDEIDDEDELDDDLDDSEIDDIDDEDDE